MAAGDSPWISLRAGWPCPPLGLGVLNTAGEQSAETVRADVQTGYRLIDTAEAYANEEGVGIGIAQSGVGRENLFITTKRLPASGPHDYDSTVVALEASLTRLNVGYVDLYLLHWPLPDQFDGTIAAWRACEPLLTEGKARAVGVSKLHRRAERRAHHEQPHRASSEPGRTASLLLPRGGARGTRRSRRRHPVVVTAGRHLHLRAHIAAAHHVDRRPR